MCGTVLCIICKAYLFPAVTYIYRHEGVLGELRYSSTHSLTSALDGGEWSASRPGLFTLRDRALGTHWIGGWVGPRTVLDVVVKRKIPSPRRESNPRTPIVQPVAQAVTENSSSVHLMLTYLISRQSQAAMVHAIENKYYTVPVCYF
jgi:hypothetical protein